MRCFSGCTELVIWPFFAHAGAFACGARLSSSSAGEASVSANSRQDRKESIILSLRRISTTQQSLTSTLWCEEVKILHRFACTTVMGGAPVRLHNGLESHRFTATPYLPYSARPATGNFGAPLVTRLGPRPCGLLVL